MTKIFSSLIILLALASQASAAVSLSVKSGEVAKTKILFIGFEPTSAELPQMKRDANEVF